MTVGAERFLCISFKWLWRILINISSAALVFVAFIVRKNTQCTIYARAYIYTQAHSAIQDTNNHLTERKINKCALNKWTGQKKVYRICKCSQFLLCKQIIRWKSFIHIQFRWNDTPVIMNVRLCDCAVLSFTFSSHNVTISPNDTGCMSHLI